MLKSPTTQALDVAFLAAKQNFKPLVRTKINPFFSRDGRIAKYADLSDVREALDPPLHAAGIIAYQSFGIANNVLAIYTELCHASTGEFRAEVVEVTCPSDPQKTGSATTYFLRYALAAICGIAPDDDDDGDAAAEKAKTTPPSAPAKPKVNHTPAKPTTEPRPNQGSEKVSGPAKPTTPELADGGDRLRTPEEKTAHNNKIRELQKASDPDKLRTYVVEKLGEDHAKATKAAWDGLIEFLQEANDNNTLKQLIGA